MLKFIKSLFHIDLKKYLKPSADIEKLEISEENFDWCAITQDPKFIFAKVNLGSGWYMVEIDIQHDQSLADAKLYVDYGFGFSELDSFFIPLKSGRISKRLIYLPIPARALRFDPMETTGLFTIRYFHLVKLFSQFAKDRLSQRLANMHFKFRDISKSDVLKKIDLEAHEKGCTWQDIALNYYEKTFAKKHQVYDYAEWIGKRENLNSLKNNSDLKVSAELPLVSIILPVFNTDICLLRDCIESVIGQSYSNWQLCIADDYSHKKDIILCLEEYRQHDKRIKVTFRKNNGHISAASNSALSLVDGDYIALLDHDDILAPHALQRVVEAISQNPQAILFYSDEDKIDEYGERFDPHLKPGWNPDLLLSQNYICHLTILKKKLVNQVGGYRTGVEGSQDHDLLLRCMPYLNSSNVVHIPEILYHWRAVSGSTAQESNAKGYAATAGLQAVSDYLKREGLSATAESGTVPNSYRVRWSIPEPAPLVSLLVPTRDGIDILRPCIEAILSKTNYSNFELIILDNQSRCKETLHFLEEVTSSDSRVSVHRWDHPFNYSAINNYGVGIAKGEIIGLINNDIEPINVLWLTEMVSQAMRPEIGCVGAKLYYPNDTIQHGGVILGIGGVAGHSHKYFCRNDYGYFSRLHLVQNLSAVTAACLLLRKEVFEKVGGLDEKNLAVAFNDVDLCLKVREAGYRNLWTPYAELYHHESVSRGADNTVSKRRRAQREAEYMRSRWGEQLDSDPAYNPNLTLVHEDFSLA